MENKTDAFPLPPPPPPYPIMINLLAFLFFFFAQKVIEFDDGSGSVLRIQPLRTHRDEAIYECTATNNVGEINTSAKLTVLEGKIRPSFFHSVYFLSCFPLTLFSLAPSTVFFFPPDFIF